LTAAQGALAKEDYASALTQAQALPARISALGTAVASKKAELTRAWGQMSAGVPQLVAALKSRVDVLAKSSGVPKGLTKDTVEQAKTGLASATAMWNDATAAAQSGDLATATEKATTVKNTVVGLMKSLNMQVPAGAGGL
jgi:hypothetical protein